MWTPIPVSDVEMFVSEWLVVIDHSWAIPCLFSGQLKMDVMMWCVTLQFFLWQRSYGNCVSRAFTSAYCPGTADQIQWDLLFLLPSVFFKLPQRPSHTEFSVSLWSLSLFQIFPLSLIHPCRVLNIPKPSIPKLGYVWSAVCQGLCVLAVECADKLWISNHLGFPHWSGNEPKHLIGYSGGVRPIGIIAFPGQISSLIPSHPFKATHLFGNSTLIKLCNA